MLPDLSWKLHEERKQIGDFLLISDQPFRIRVINAVQVITILKGGNHKLPEELQAWFNTLMEKYNKVSDEELGSTHASLNEMTDPELVEISREILRAYDTVTKA